METEQAVKKERRPFHETIIDAIRDARNLDSGEALECFASLIKRTKIPSGHNKIIAVWNLAVEDAGRNEEEFGVMADLLEQKQEAEAKVTDLASGFDDNGKERALMIVIEKIIGCLQNQPEGRLASKISDVIFKLFETAKQIYRAKDERGFQTAIADL